MPKIVPDFEASLVSWQPPKRFLESLGHSISASGPSGLVEGMTVLSAPPPPDAVKQGDSGAYHEPLPLAVPPAGSIQKAPTRIWRLPWRREDPAPTAEPPPEETLPSPAASMPEERPPDAPPAIAPLDEPLTAAEPIRASEPAPAPTPDPEPAFGQAGTAVEPTAAVADLVGSVPLTAVVQPLAASPEETPENRFVRAPAPPDMPLAYLPSALLPKEAREEPSAPLGPGQITGYQVAEVLLPAEAGEEPSAPPGAGQTTGYQVAEVASESPVRSDELGPTDPAALTAGLVGERPVITESMDRDLSLSVGPAPVDEETTSGDLPLVSPPPSPATDEAPRFVPTVGNAGPLTSEPFAALPPLPAEHEQLPLAPALSAGSPPAPEAPLPPSPAAEEAEPAGDISTPAGPLRPPAAPSAAPSLTVEEPTAVAPLLGEAPPVTGEPPPVTGEAPPVTGELTAAVPALEAADQPARNDAEPAVQSRPLILPRPPTGPRSGLGEPMGSLPATATSWDITTWSPAQQHRASRALMRTQTLRPDRTSPPAAQPLAQVKPSPVAARSPSGPSPAETVVAPRSFAHPALERVQSPTAGLTPPELPPAGSQLAPLLSLDPLVLVEPIEAGRSRSAPPPEGLRVRTAIGHRQGVDLTDVPLDRSAQGAVEAERGRARAFTSDRAIVVPSDVGSLETGPGEALFAHELTHAAQRARLGPNLPDESSPAGRLLEAEALSAELTLASPQSSSLEWPNAGRRPSTSALAGDAVSGRYPVGGLPLAAAAASGPDVGSLAASILDRMSVLSSPAPVGETTQVFTPPWSSSPAPAPSAPVQRADQLTAPASGPAAAPATSEQDQAGPFSSRPSDHELNNLSRWLYPLIKYRLKGELREDRERAGLLTDHYRRW